jgi:surface polysaccharide O-acyltransferase-like enzyme
MSGKKLAGNRYRAIQRLHYTYFLLSYCFLFGGTYMTEDRDLSFDAFRGFAIIAVVAIHAVVSVFAQRHFSAEPWNFFFLFAYFQLLEFAVPAFLFISGYWLSKRPINSLEDYKVFLMKRFSRVLIPYLFWSCLLLGYGAVTIDIRETIHRLLTGGASVGYFFIIMIVQLYMLTPFLQYINRRRAGLVLVIVFNVLSLFTLYLSRLFHVIGHLPASLPFYSWIIFFEMGLWIGMREDKLGNKMVSLRGIRPLILPALVICFLISVLEGMVLLMKYDNLNFAISPTKYSSVLFSVFVILGFLSVREHIKHYPKFLVTLGNYSFGIYLINTVILNRVVGLLQRFDIVYSLQPLYQLLLVFITVSICVLVISISRRLLPKFFCGKILGFCSPS